MGIKVDKILGVVRESDTTTSLPASSVVFTPNGDISAVTVQAAIQEVRDDAVTKINAAVVGLLDDRGGFTPTTSYPTTGGSGTAGAILKGDIWQVTGLGIGVTALMGGVTVSDGQWFRALIDTPGQTDANWTETSSGGATIYTANGTSTDNTRLIKTKTSDNASWYSFQTSGATDIMRIYGDKTVRYGTGDNCYFDTSFTVPILQFYNVGSSVIRMYDYYTGLLNCEMGIGGGQGFLKLNYDATNGLELYGLTHSLIGKGGAGFGLTVGGARIATEVFGVVGSSIFKGGGSTSATYNSIWKNSSSVQALSIRDDGWIDFGAVGVDQEVKHYGGNGERELFYNFAGDKWMSYNTQYQVITLFNSGNTGVQISSQTAAGRITTYGNGATLSCENGTTYIVSAANNGNPYSLWVNAGVTKVQVSGYGSGYIAVGAASIGAYNLEITGTSWFNGLVNNVKGADIASAADLTLTTNSHTITGTTTINAMTILPFIAGTHITLVFSGATTVKHNTAGGAGTAVFKLAGSVDFVTAADTVLGLYYDGTVFQQTFEKHS